MESPKNKSVRYSCPTFRPSVSAALGEKEVAYRANLTGIVPVAGAAMLLDFTDRRNLKRTRRAPTLRVLAALGLEARLSRRPLCRGDAS